MNKKIIIGIGVTIAVAIVIVGYNKGWFGEKKSSTTTPSTPSPEPKSNPDAISQQEADTIASKMSDIIKFSNDKYGGMTSQTNDQKNKLADQLFKGGYSFVGSNGIYKAVKNKQ